MTTKQKRQQAIQLYSQTHCILALKRFLGLKTMRATIRYIAAQHNLYVAETTIMENTPHRQGCGDFQEVAEVR
jgi:hypothetical protein